MIMKQIAYEAVMETKPMILMYLLFIYVFSL